jgi:hypothetical protein
MKKSWHLTSVLLVFSRVWKTPWDNVLGKNKRSIQREMVRRGSGVTRTLSKVFLRCQQQLSHVLRAWLDKKEGKL